MVKVDNWVSVRLEIAGFINTFFDPPALRCKFLLNVLVKN